MALALTSSTLRPAGLRRAAAAPKAVVAARPVVRRESVGGGGGWGWPVGVRGGAGALGIGGAG